MRLFLRNRKKTPRFQKGTARMKTETTTVPSGISTKMEWNSNLRYYPSWNSDLAAGYLTHPPLAPC